MTVADTANRIQYTGNGVADTFSTGTIVFYDDTDLIVTERIIATGVETVLTLGAGNDYTVTGGDGSAGSITLTAGALPATKTITIERSIPYSQDDQYPEGETILAEVLETRLDKLTIQNQQNRDATNRSVKLSSTLSSSLNPVINDTPVDGNLLSWDGVTGAISSTSLSVLLNAGIDVVLTSPISGNILQYNGTNWVNLTLSGAGVKDLGVSNIDELTAFASIADQSDLVAVYDTSANETKKLTYRNFFATIDDISAFNDAPASNDKFAIVNVSNGNANAIEHEELMRVVNLTEDASPDLANDFLLSYDASASQAKKVKPSSIVNSDQLAKAWVRFDGSTATINDSYNITSVTRNSSGNYTITIANDFANTNYCAVGVADDTGAGTVPLVVKYKTFATGALTIETRRSDTVALFDADIISVVFYGDLA